MRSAECTECMLLRSTLCMIDRSIDRSMDWWTGTLLFSQQSFIHSFILVPVFNSIQFNSILFSDSKLTTFYILYLVFFFFFIAFVAFLLNDLVEEFSQIDNIIQFGEVNQRIVSEGANDDTPSPVPIESPLCVNEKPFGVLIARTIQRHQQTYRLRSTTCCCCRIVWLSCKSIRCRLDKVRWFHYSIQFGEVNQHIVSEGVNDWLGHKR